MYKISLIPHTGKWQVTTPAGRVLGDKYSSAYKAAQKLTAYLKGQKA